jgi:beta-glucosidase/6-phospho-beta-glucosidase/beta-galactosidase
VTRRGAPRRVLEAVAGSHRGRTLDAVSFDWYDPIASHAIRLPGRRAASGGRDWSFSRTPWDVEAHPQGLRSWCVTEAALYPGLPLWIAENGMATQIRGDEPLPREDGMDRPRYVREHLKTVVETVEAGVPVTAYLHWSLVDNYEWGSYEPRFGLFGLDRSNPLTVRWLDTDAQGHDAAGEFARVVAGLRAGDRAVLDAPA